MGTVLRTRPASSDPTTLQSSVQALMTDESFLYPDGELRRPLRKSTLRSCRKTLSSSTNRVVSFHPVRRESLARSCELQHQRRPSRTPYPPRPTARPRDPCRTGQRSVPS